MSELPLVSVVTPAYNAERFIEQALRSALTQTYKNIEVLVVDDGSDDDTRRIAEDLSNSDERLSVLNQSNQGVASARNLGIEHARGDYIAPLDADDVWYPEKLEKQVRCVLDSDPRTGLVYGWYHEIDENGDRMKDGSQWIADGSVYTALAVRNFIGGGSMPLMKRSCFDKVGGYSSRLREMGGEGCEDWDLYLRIAEHYHFRVVPEYLAGYRRHSANMSLNRTAMGLSRRMVLEDIDRRGIVVPPRVLRWAKASRCLFDLETAYQCRDYTGAMALGWEALDLDAVGFLTFLSEKLRTRMSQRSANGQPENVDEASAPYPYKRLSFERFQWILENRDDITDERVARAELGDPPG